MPFSGGSTSSSTVKVDVPNIATNSNILTASTSVDIATHITFTQTTASITATLLNPTITTVNRNIVLQNLPASTQSLTITAVLGDTFTLLAGQSIEVVWNGTSWRLLNEAQVATEFGSVILANQVFSTNAFVNSTNGTYTIPSAGTWKLRYDISTDGTGANTNSQLQIINSSSVLVAGTERTRGASVTTALNLTAEAIVVTTGATTFTLQGRNGGSGTMTILNNSTYTGTISWEKISGFIPTVGSTIDYVRLSKTSTQSIASANTIITFNSANGNIPVNTATGQITLTAGKTYEITANVNSVAGSTAARPTFTLFNVTTGLAIGNTFGFYAPNDSASNSGSGTGCQVIITPLVTTIIEFRSLVGIGSGSISAGDFSGGLGESAWLAVKQLGSTATTSGTFVLSNVAPTATSVVLNWAGLATNRYELLIAINKSLYSSTGVLNGDVRRVNLFNTTTYTFNSMTQGTVIECQIINRTTSEHSNLLSITGTAAITPSSVVANTVNAYTTTPIPTGARFVQFKLWGASGGGGAYSASGYSGTGGYTTNTVDLAEARFAGLTLTSVLTVMGVGGTGNTGQTATGAGGYPDGGGGLVIGDTSPSGGGGSSRAYLVTSTNEKILIAVAGGGGGNCGYNITLPGHGGGDRLYVPANNDSSSDITEEGYVSLAGSAPALGTGAANTAGGFLANPGGRFQGGGLPTGTSNGGPSGVYNSSPDSAGGGGGYWGGRLRIGDGAVGNGGSGFALRSVYTLNQAGAICTSLPLVAPVVPNNADVDWANPAAAGVLSGSPASASGATGNNGRVVIKFS